MSTFIAVLAVVVKNLINSYLCQVWIIWTSIAVLWVVGKKLNRILFIWTFIAISALVVENYLDFCLCQLLIMWTSVWGCCKDLTRFLFMWTFIVKFFLSCGLYKKYMSNLVYVNFHCSFSSCSKESYKFLSMPSMDYMDFHCRFIGCRKKI